MNNNTQIIPPRVLLVDPRTGLITREWYRYFFNRDILLGGGDAGEGNTGPIWELENSIIAGQVYGG